MEVVTASYDRGKSAPGPSKALNSYHPVTAQEILRTEYPDLPWVVPGLIPVGLTLLASQPKMGKSWLCLNLAVAVATGGKVLGHIDVTPQEVLYIALEDTLRRIKSRLQMFCKENPSLSRLRVLTKWPQVNGGGLTALKDWMEDNPKTRLIIIDTLARIRGFRRSGSTYDADYKEITKFKALTDEYGISIILVHHMRKSAATDVVDRVSGSTGLTAAADNVALLLRNRSQAEATLNLYSRDVEDQKLALRFEAGSGSWIIMGKAEEYRLTRERQEIIDLLRREGRSCKLKDITEALGKKKPNVSNLLNSLKGQGLVEKEEYGKYRLKAESSGEPGTDTVSDEPGESYESLIKSL